MLKIQLQGKTGKDALLFGRWQDMGQELIEQFAVLSSGDNPGDFRWLGKGGGEAAATIVTLLRDVTT